MGRDPHPSRYACHLPPSTEEGLAGADKLPNHQPECLRRPQGRDPHPSRFACHLSDGFTILVTACTPPSMAAAPEHGGRPLRGADDNLCWRRNEDLLALELIVIVFTMLLRDEKGWGRFSGRI